MLRRGCIFVSFCIFVLLFSSVTHTASVSLIETFAGEASGGGLGYPAREIGDYNGDGYADWAAWTDEASLNVYFGGDPPDTLPDLVIGATNFTGNAFAYLAGRCDLNNDGFGDIALAAPYPRRVHIYLGSATPDNSRDLVLAVGDPEWVASAGDINGDGYCDLLTSNDDSTYVYLGALVPDNIPDMMIPMGREIAGVGDVDDDGFDDFAIGRGPTSIFLGDSIPDAVPDVILATSWADWRADQTIAGGGDFNGDGFDDIAIGEHNHDNPGTPGGYDGQVTVFFGGSPMDTSPDWVNEWTGGEFGYSVAFAGDATQNGYDDLLVGAPHLGWGEAYLFEGGGSPSLEPHLTFSTNVVYEGVGFGVAGLGDANGDLKDDFLVSPSYYQMHEEVHVRLYFGGAALDSIPDLMVTDEYGHELGYAVTEAGNLNGDGYLDWAIGVPRDPHKGRTYAYFGAAVLDTIRDVTMTKNMAFGMDLDPAGNIKNDGYDDLLVRRAKCGDYVYIFQGGSPMDSLEDSKLSSDPSCGDAGTYYMSPAGDFNGDGYDDVLVGLTSFFGPGWVELYYGGVPFNKVPDAYLSPGFRCAGMGNINGDIYDDVAVGREYVTSTSGEVRIFLGAALTDTFPDSDIVLEVADRWFGSHLSFAGDINDDGFDDLMVSAAYNNDTGGDVYLYYCSPYMDTLPDVIIPCDADTTGFGSVLEPLGDINGDSYDDIAIGAPHGADNKGRVHIFLGGDPMDNVADIVLEGEAAKDLFGFAIAGIGDVNGDGEREILIGAPGYDDKRGKAYMYAGSRASVSSPGGNGAFWVTVGPSPFADRTAISWSQSIRAHTVIEVYDVTGRFVRGLVREQMSAGTHAITWDGLDRAGRQAAPGIYFVWIDTGGVQAAKRVVLLR